MQNVSHFHSIYYNLVVLPKQIVVACWRCKQNSPLFEQWRDPIIISVCISDTFFEKIWSTIINKYVLRLETGDPREKLDTQELLSKF